MSSTNVEIVKRLFERPPEAELPGLLDPEIEIYDYDLPDAGVYRGHEGFARYLADWEEPWHDWSWTVEEMLESGDQVTALFSITARSASGAETTRRSGIVLTLRSGRIVRFEYFTTQDEARAAAAIPSSSG